MENQISVIQGPPGTGKDTNDIEYYCQYINARENGADSIQ